MRSSLFLRFLLLGALAGLVIILFGRRPVLLHVFADTGCACGEYHAQVTGLMIRNPFRDRSPEERAAKFLEELRNKAARCIDDVDLAKFWPTGQLSRKLSGRD